MLNRKKIWISIGKGIDSNIVDAVKSGLLATDNEFISSLKHDNTTKVVYAMASTSNLSTLDTMWPRLIWGFAA